MATLIIRKLDDEVKVRLRVRAAEKGVSMEQEARRILTAAVSEPSSAPASNIADAIAEIMSPVGGLELDLPVRASQPPDPSLDWFRGEDGGR